MPFNKRIDAECLLVE